ncbi:MAG: response regulator [Arenimonas sp.]
MNRPRLLLLEDDPVSLAFLRDALAPLPVDLDVALTCVQAEAIVAADHALWLFDAHLPDGDAGALLARLRARGLDTAALALTAATELATQARLLDAGFARVLDKPIAGVVLRRAVLDALPESDGPWDDLRALPALGGRAEALMALRELFLRDLPAQISGVRDAAARGDPAAARAELHRLKAGCGFVGATGLMAAVSALHARPQCSDALESFLHHGAELLGEA